MNHPLDMNYSLELVGVELPGGLPAANGYVDGKMQTECSLYMPWLAVVKRRESLCTDCASLLQRQVVSTCLQGPQGSRVINAGSREFFSASLPAR